MTKERAIKHLKLMQSGARNAIRFSKNDKEISEEERKEDIEIYQDQLESLNVAIKALEQQPSDDCVSRQAILDAITEIDENINMDIYTNEVREIINEMPPVTPTHCIAVVKFSKEDLKNICDKRIEIECTHGTCKDCTNYIVGALDEEICLRGHELIHKDFYCADFEKRGNVDKVIEEINHLPQIEDIPIVQAIPLDRVKQAREEIKATNDATYIIMEILDKLIAESES